LSCAKDKPKFAPIPPPLRHTLFIWYLPEPCRLACRTFIFFRIIYVVKLVTKERTRSRPSIRPSLGICATLVCRIALEARRLLLGNMQGHPLRMKKQGTLLRRLGLSRSTSPKDPQAPSAGASNTPLVHTSAFPSLCANPVVPAAPSAPPARDLWSDALQTLSQDEQQAIQDIQPTQATQRPLSTRIEELVSITRTKQEECEKESYKFRFQGKEIILRDVAGKIIGWLNKFKTVGDVVVNFDPVHASLPWAGVRFLLQVLIGPILVKKTC
jgi:hypothetical protein